LSSTLIYMSSLKEPSFLQSSYWQSFQESLGHKTIYVDGKGYSCLLVERTTKVGDYLLAPCGPTADSLGSLAKSLEHIKQAGKQSGASWLKIEPHCEAAQKSQIESTVIAAGGQKATRNFNPGTTRIIDLRPSIDQIFAGLSSTNRTLIRRNDKANGITFTTSTRPADINLFVQMVKTVESRNKVHFYSNEYYTKQADTLMPAGVMFLELAYYQNKPVASTIIHQFDAMASYTYAASLPEARDTNASTLLAWQAIKNTKDRGATKFDFFGVAPPDAPADHPWQGFSAFKAKFGGQIIDFAGTWDIPLSPRYKLYKLAKRVT